jgi:hypothetical protein
VQDPNYVQQGYSSVPPDYAAQQQAYAGAPPQGYAGPPQQVYAGPAPGDYSEAQVARVPDPAYGDAAPQYPQGGSVEQRAQRLDQMCRQHLFSAQECSTRRAQLLQEM